MLERLISNGPATTRARWAEVFRLNVPPILLLTTRAGVGGGVPPERTCDSAFDHARWGEHLEVPDWRISGDSRPCALWWIQGSAPERRISKGPATTRAGAGKGFRKCLLSCHPDGAQPPGLRLRLPPRALGAPCQYFRDAAAERYSLRSSHRKLALLPTCKGSRGGQASEVAPSEAQGGGRGITRMAEHRGRNRRRHFRLLEACCACCSRWRL